MNFASTLGAYVLSILFAASSSNVLASIVVNEPQIAQSWAKSAATFDKLLWPQSEPLLNLIDNLTTSQSVPISQTCRSSLRVIAAGIRGRRIWALKCEQTLQLYNFHKSVSPAFPIMYIFVIPSPNPRLTR